MTPKEFTQRIKAGEGWFHFKPEGISSARLRVPDFEYYDVSWYSCGRLRSSEVPRGKPNFSVAEKNEIVRELTQYGTKGDEK